MRKPAKTQRPARAASAAEFAVDPLLVGADREFVESFPVDLLVRYGALPIRRYHEVGLVVTHSGLSGREGLEGLQKASRVRLVRVPAVHDYGVELFLRYLETGDGDGPPLWVPDSRKAYLTRQGKFTSPKTAPLVASIVLTSPLTSAGPVMVASMGKEGYVLFLHGTGLKAGVRFSGGVYEEVLSRLKIEFGMAGDGIAAPPQEPWLEGRGGKARGLDDLTALLLPPLATPSFIIEPKNPRR